jgi:CNT family concentrative nucleoside transporter
MTRYHLISFVGMFVLLGFAWLCSCNRRCMNWRLILVGIGLQLALGAFLFMVPAGRLFFVGVSGAVDTLLAAASKGATFVFGVLALGPGQTDDALGTSLGFILGFQALPTIIFFSALVSVLYYIRVFPLLIRGFAFVFTGLMRISGAESLCAASNIFVGVESSLTVKPHLDRMTRSELCTVLTVGMATVASNVLAVYVFKLSTTFKLIAGHLVSASILSAPAALVMSKILVPETGEPETLGVHVRPHYERDNSVFEAVINGANNGARLVLGIITLLIAVLGIVALLNTLLGSVFGVSLEEILGAIFYPFARILGVQAGDAVVVAELLGERAVATEIPAYQHLADAMAMGTIRDPRSALIATYALCGFAHIASLAIFVGGVAALSPSRTRDLAAVGGRALLAATLACLMTACVAGVFPMDQSILLGPLGASAVP